MKKIVAVLLMGLVLLVGCATIQVQEEIAGSAVALGKEPPSLIIGTKFTFKKINMVTDEVQYFTWIVKSKVNWLGTTPAYVIDAGEGYYIWDTNLNYLASLSKDGRVVSAVTPATKNYSWPLSVGKQWNAIYTNRYFTATSVASEDITDTMKVIDSQLPINLAFGSRKVFVIERKTALTIERHFYAPELVPPDFGFEVRTEVSYIDPLKAGVTKTELIRYEIPGVGTAGEKPKQ